MRTGLQSDLAIPLVVLSIIGSVGVRAASAEPPAPKAAAFFEAKIRPILAENCFKCHADKKQKGGLRLDSLTALLTGGDRGPAIVPGQPEKSLLVKAISHNDPELKMPPAKKLAKRQIEDLANWVKMGSPWPGVDSATKAAPLRGEFKISDKDRAYWAFRPVARAPVPRVRNAQEVFNPIDAFVLAKLEANGLRQNHVANRRELLRRAYFDLLGLPPTPEEIEAFIKDKSPDAWENVIDRLLASPQYGERWGRHWLDVVRYAQTNGYERDDEKPFAWRYRDYVIRSFNADEPYDQFIREQLAGDEILPHSDDAVIATGYYRLGVWDDEPDDTRQAVFDELDDIITTTGQAFLGLTINCARCHDHKFDPISQRDYYKLLAFLDNIKGYEKPRFVIDSATLTALGNGREKLTRLGGGQKTGQKRKAQGSAAGVTPASAAAPGQANNLDIAWALSVHEKGRTAPKTHVLIRGNAASEGDEVEPGFPDVLAPAKLKPTSQMVQGEGPLILSPRPRFGGEGSGVRGTKDPRPRPLTSDPSPRSTGARGEQLLPLAQGESTGRRLALADWIASADNPLTARVLVNRIWQHHLGRGLVPTPNDFGKTGLGPTHPELLDWLAAEFIEGGWRIKHLHKRIMMSRVYQISSSTENPPAHMADEGNELYWRQNLHRLEAEAIRDATLAVSGQLRSDMGGRGVFVPLSKEVVAGQSRPGLGWEISAEAELGRRSVYLFVKRTMLAPILETLDYNNTAQTMGERPVTTVAPQALMLLNSEFIQGQAEAFAERLVREAGRDPQAQARQAYRLALGRDPTEHESQIATAYLCQQTKAFAVLQPPLTIAPKVPASLHEGYLHKLQPLDFLEGPKAGWAYYPGRWGNSYEQIQRVDIARGPFALFQSLAFGDATIECLLRLHQASEMGGLIIRARPHGDEFVGYDLTFDPRNKLAMLRRHGEKDLQELAQVKAGVRMDHEHRLKVQIEGPRIRVWLDSSDKPLLDVTDSRPLAGQGNLGLRAWGSALSAREFFIRAGGKTTRVDSAQPLGVEEAERQALRSLCLVILNLNEFVYVD